MKTTRLDVQGMSCGACVRHVQNALTGVPGVSGVQVDLAGARAEVTHADDVGAQVLIAALEHGGYTAALKTSDAAP